MWCNLQIDKENAASVVYLNIIEDATFVHTCTVLPGEFSQKSRNHAQVCTYCYHLILNYTSSVVQKSVDSG